MQARKLGILIYDIEVSPALGWFYPPLYKTNVFRVEQHQILMSISWAWYGEVDKKGKPIVHNAKLNDYKTRYKADKLDDYELTKKLHEILNQAEIVVGHNSRRFDNKMANTFFMKHGLGPTSPYKTVDTLSDAKGYFRYTSNKLDEISKQRGSQGKTAIRVGDLWYDCLVNGNPKSWKLMQEYNDQDIVETYNRYEEQRPYIRNHPNMGVYLQQQGVCAHCGKSGTLQSRGESPRVNGMVRQYWCNPKHGGCKGWNYEKIHPEERTPMEDRPDMVSS